ncbi:hypothetical protein L3Q82_019636 [Scortum barcoo]|uniref:Uncharacterized protein n=1 Tax=Scortum barcoo TaxID=214431 RepID=A0ACB8VC22_9TELE|nr:hypothetical protein L3Q82_019636 [Scortum barcoo]
MQHTSCTEDRIQHALDRCLDGLRQSPTAAHHWNVLMCSAGQSMNRWSLEEMVKRDPENFLILLQQIIRKTREVQEQCQYELVAPLAIMFSSTLLQTPYCPPDTELLEEAIEVFRCFLTWPEPYCSVCTNLLSTLQLEIKAPGISFQRLVREEQGLATSSQCSKTMTVLLMNSSEVPADFLSVAKQLSCIQHSQKETYITLIKHAFQSTLGTKYPLQSIHRALQEKTVTELGEIFSMVSDISEKAAAMSDPQKGRSHVIQELEQLRERLRIPPSNGRKSDGMLQTLPLPTAKCYMFHWEKDNFDVLNTLLEHDLDDLATNGQTEGEEEVDIDDDVEEDATEMDAEEEEEEEDKEEGEQGVELPSISIITNGCSTNHRASTFSTISSLSTASKDSMFSTLSVTSESYAPSLFSVTSGVDSDYFEDSDDYMCSSPVAEKCSPKSASKTSARLSQHFYRLFIKPKSTRSLSRAKSLGNTESKDLLVVREKRSNSLPQQVKLRSPETFLQPQSQTLRHVCFRRRPILSSDEDSKNTTLRVVVFGADHVAGKVARAYNSLRRKESACPRLSRAFNLQFYFVPVKRDSAAGQGRSPGPAVQSGTPKGCDLHVKGMGDSTNDIANLLGMLDPWYERNTLSLLNLPANVVCQQTSKTESESYDSSYEQRLPILADLVLYYCRNAARPALIQLYQAELTLACGERRTEVFVHSLELGHTAGTRAIKAMGAASKRFGIDGDREAVPLMLDVMYNRVVISGRSQWKRETKVCTSVNFTKACKNPEELDSKMECLQLTMTEVLKRQNGKGKKGYNQQLSVTEVKVDKVQVSGAGNTTFAVCLDQDEKKKKYCKVLPDMTNKAPWDNSSSMCSMEPTVGCSPTVPEPELYRRIQAVLPRQTNNQQSPDCFNKGMLRWTLHKKVQNNPANSLSLVWVLIKELEKAERWDSRSCIIPLLHTLMYAIIQTAYIPDELYKRLYDFCKRLLTYPQPYCTVGLSYTRQLKTERSIPGLMYQRMLTAEQRLKNEHYPFQERVFVLADPEIFSGSLGQVLLGDIEASASASASGGSLGPLDHLRSVVQHSIQAALGAEQCHGPKLAQALKDMGQDIEPYFQEVLAALEQSVEEGSRGEGKALRSRLQQLYNEIVAEADSEPLSGGPLCDCPLPNPEMSFHLWTEDLDIWRELAKWFRSSSMSEQFSLGQEPEDFDLSESLSDLMLSDMTRFSIMSNDSGIERDLPPSADPSLSSSLDSASMAAAWEQCKSEQDFSKLSRRGGIKMKPSVKDSMVLMQDTLEDHPNLGAGAGVGSKGGRRGATLQRRAGSSVMQNPFPKQQRLFTARIVTMGDDRVLGRLAKAYYFFRKREARRLFLTMKVNLQFYYIPVCRATTPISPVKENLHQSKGNPCTLGSYLSMVDPWYNSNIRSLGCMIPKLAEMQQANPGRPKEPFVSDVISYYVRTGQQPVYFSIYFVKIIFTSTTKDPVEDVFLTHLEIEFPEFKQISASNRDKQKKSSAEVCGAVVSINYRKVTLSGRDIDKGISVRMSGAQISAIPSNEAEDLNCLTLTMNESPTKTKNNVVESKFRTSNIKIRTLESRSFTLTLDRDSRRTYKDVQSIEISPCLDPGYCVQKTMRSKFKLGEDKDAGLSKYMSKGLPLPINTFAGIIT